MATRTSRSRRSSTRSSATKTPSSSTYNVRLVPEFTHPRGHRRAGFVFKPGPQVQTLKLNKEQLALIKADPSLEIVSAAEAKKINERFGLTPEQEGSTDELQNPANVTGEVDDNTTPQTGRRYVNPDPTRPASPEFDAKTGVLEQRAGTGDGTPPATQSELESPAGTSKSIPTAPEPSFADLKARAQELGIEDIGKLRSKAALTEAIEAKTTTTSEE